MQKQAFQKQNDRHNLDPETLQDLQESLYEWQIYNFGDQDNERVLLGVCEEVGELCHAVLKKEQGIRGTPEEHDNELRDAIGDIMIYTLNYLSKIKAKVTNLAVRDDVEKNDDPKRTRESVLACFRIIGKLTDPPNRENVQLINQMIIQLSFLCALRGWSLEKIVRDTWSRVGKRDWKKFPDTGEGPESSEE